MSRTNELRMLATKYECRAMDGFELAERLRFVANAFESEAIVALAEEALRSSKGLRLDAAQRLVAIPT